LEKTTPFNNTTISWARIKNTTQWFPRVTTISWHDILIFEEWMFILILLSWMKAIYDENKNDKRV